MSEAEAWSGEHPRNTLLSSSSSANHSPRPRPTALGSADSLSYQLLSASSVCIFYLNSKSSLKSSESYIVPWLSAC